MNWLAGELGITSPQDWNNVTARDIAEHFGAGLLSFYGGSLSKSAVHLLFLFIDLVLTLVKTGKIVQESLETSRHFMESLQHNMGSNITFWYSKAKTHMIFTILQNDSSMLLSSKREIRLIHVMKELFPDQSMVVHYKHPQLMFASNYLMEFDIFIPSLSLAVEYQGEQHFDDRYYGGMQLQRDRDRQKREVTLSNKFSNHQECAKHKITLVEVPFWWKGDRASLAATIRQHRSELLPHDLGTPIPNSYRSVTVEKRTV